MGITETGIAGALPQSAGGTEFYDIGTSEPYCISGKEIEQRRRLKEVIENKAADTDYATAYKYVIEEVAYTWFNRLIAVRFMEVNDYLPGHIRVLSSETGKMEPDLVTTPFDAELVFTSSEEERIIQLKQDNKIDELFRMLFIKQCNALNELLPALFEKTNDYTEILLTLSVIDQEGVVYRLVHDIPEEDFDVNRGGQVEITGWLYQYYNTELNEQVYDGNMSKSKIPKELLPAATTIYTPDWAIRYMVENSLGRLWLENHPSEELKSKWKFYLEKLPTDEEINDISVIMKKNEGLRPEELLLLDPCMGSGHILVYAFDILMDIYESEGYSQRDAANSIVSQNLYGLDIDDRAFQIAYFAIMMKARQYNRRILNSNIKCHLYSIKESNNINQVHLKYMGTSLNTKDVSLARQQMKELINSFYDAKEYGSIISLPHFDRNLLLDFINNTNETGQLTFDSYGLDVSVDRLRELIELASVLSKKYHVVCTNPPYLGNSRFSPKLDKYIKKNYPSEKSDLSMVMFRRVLDGYIAKNGYVAFITTNSWMFLSRFEKLRDHVLDNYTFESIVDFGTELFEGKVGHNPIISWVNKASTNPTTKFTAIRLVDYCYGRREQKMREYFNRKNYYYPSQDSFKKIPGHPITYSFSKPIIEAFETCQSVSMCATTRLGMTTADNNKFVRLWFEVNHNNSIFDAESEEQVLEGKYKWVPYNKGGKYRKWYGNQDCLVNWENSGYEIKNFADDKGHIRSTVPNTEYYFLPCVTWSKISSGSIAFRYRFAGSIFDVAGACLYANEGIFSIMGFLNSNVARNILSVLSPTLNYEGSHIAALPIKKEMLGRKDIEDTVVSNISIAKNDWDSFEFSWDFKEHPLLKGKTIKNAFEEWNKLCDMRYTKLKTNEEWLNKEFIDMYEMGDELSPDVDEKDIIIHRANEEEDIKSLLSYAVGCMFGRYSLDEVGLVYAGGHWDSSKYSKFIPDEDGIIPITDEEYFDDDIVARLSSWLKAVYGDDTLEENLDYIAKYLGKKGISSREIIRNYFVDDFFREHCSYCSNQTSGKRPIYWLFDSGKQNGFKALIYLHRYTPDTIGNLRVDYLHRMQRVYESEMNRMQDMIEHSTNSREVAAASKRKEKLQKQLKECREYDEKIGHLALDRIELDLDDGVKYNYRKIQTGRDGKFYEVLADSKSIMMDAKKYADFKK